MANQLDMFAAPNPPVVTPAPNAAPSEVVFTIVPKGDRFAVDWRCGDQIGVLGGLYSSREEAQWCIEYRKELRAQGIQDPRPHMRIPREGARP